MKPALLSKACLLAVLLFQTSCATYSSDRWKQRVEKCRQAPSAEIDDAPREFLAMPAWAIGLLGVIRRERAEDAIEWDCINDL